MMTLLDYIDGVPPLTLDQVLVCVLPLLIAQAVILVPVTLRRRRK